MFKLIENEQKSIVQYLVNKQNQNGSWKFCFESGIMTDAYMIILLKSIQLNDSNLITMLAKRIAAKQYKEGYWKAFDDEEGNLSATIEAYFALLYSGFYDKGHPNMLLAEKYILEKGGLKKADPMTKVMLAITGQYHWPNQFKFPIEMLLLPISFPINFYDFASYSRVHFAPIMLLADRQFIIKNSSTPNLSHLYLASSSLNWELNSVDEKWFERIQFEINQLPFSASSKHKKAIKIAEEFILDRIDKDGTLYNYFSATFLMIFALLSLGYHVNSSVIRNAINGLRYLFPCKTNDGTLIQNSPSVIWDTALITSALQDSRLPVSSPTIVKANQFLFSHQQKKYGDWVIHNPNILPGGWGFSEYNTFHPDNDDTVAALDASYHFVNINRAYFPSWQRGLNWLLSMQNNDGGWAAFEKNTNKRFLTLIPVQNSNDIIIDPSTPDLTGRILTFLGNKLNLNYQNPIVNRAIKWLLVNQRKDGSWEGRWGVHFIYGTWAAIKGLSAVGLPENHPAIQRGIKWLHLIQNEDGGWGESCNSDIHHQYIPLNASTTTQTAWALDALISVYNKPNSSINDGIKKLIDLRNKSDWRTTYPTGAGLPGSFYIYYHSYPFIWPLVTLSHYHNKFK